MEYIKKIITASLITTLLIAGFLTVPESEAEAAFRPSGYVGKLLTRLNEGGSETTFRTTPGTAPDGTSLTTAKIGDYIVLTINPGAANEEKISATAVSVSGTTATWTIGTRGLSYTENAQVTDNINQHAIGETVIVSDDDHFLATQYPARDVDETINGTWSFGYPTASTSAATKGYVDAIVNGGAVNVDRLAVAATAGESFATGTPVYFKSSDQRWWKADADLTEAYNAGLIGIAQGAGAAATGISGGVLILGYDQTQVGMTPGTNLFVSATAGATTTSTTTIALGKARTATVLYVDPKFNHPSPAGTNSFTGSNTFATSSITIGSFPAYNIGKNMQAFTSTGTTTFSVPTGVTKVSVWTCGAGGGGRVVDGDGGGGGGGGCAFENVDVTGTSTIQVFVGTGGTSGTDGTAGTWSTFGTNGFYNYGNGGAQGTEASGGLGGSASGGDLNFPGQTGGDGIGTGAVEAGIGGSCMLGFGGMEGDAAVGYCGGSAGGNTVISGGNGIVIVSW